MYNGSRKPAVMVILEAETVDHNHFTFVAQMNTRKYLLHFLWSKEQEKVNSSQGFTQSLI